MQHTTWRAKYANYGNRDVRMLFSASLSHALDPFGAHWILVCEASDAFSAPRIPRPTAHDPLGVQWILVCETSDAFSASCIPRPNAHDPLGFNGSSCMKRLILSALDVSYVPMLVIPPLLFLRKMCS